VHILQPASSSPVTGMMGRYIAVGVGSPLREHEPEFRGECGEVGGVGAAPCANIRVVAGPHYNWDDLTCAVHGPC